jgi:hypothetical protein
MRKSPFALFVAALIAAPAAGVDMHCVDRDGRCMEVSVNGHKAVKLGKSTKKMLAGMKSAQHQMQETRYEIPAPIQGELDVKADRSADSKDWFGEGRSFEVMVVPLAEVKLETHQQLSTADNVRVEGAAPVTVENVLEGNRLPPGPYILFVTLRGDSNWDRMGLFVQVTESGFSLN